MSLGNSAENALLLLLFNNTSWANIGNAGGLLQSTVAGSFYVSLCTANPGQTGDQTTSETAYTNYVRVAVARSSAGWTVSGSNPTTSVNFAATTFAACGATGATLTYFVVGRDSTSTGMILWYGALTSSLAVSSGITPSFAASALSCGMQ